MSNSAWNTSVLHSQAMALWTAQSYLKVMKMKMTQAANSKCGVHLLYGIVPFHSQTWPVSDVCLCLAVLKTSQKLSIQTASAPLYAADSHWEAKPYQRKSTTQKMLPFWASCIMSQSHYTTAAWIKGRSYSERPFCALITAVNMKSLEHSCNCASFTWEVLLGKWKGLNTSPLDPPLWKIKTVETLFHLAWKAEI